MRRARTAASAGWRPHRRWDTCRCLCVTCEVKASPEQHRARAEIGTWRGARARHGSTRFGSARREAALRHGLRSLGARDNARRAARGHRECARACVPEARQGGTVFSAQGSGERVATTFGSTACEIVIQSPTTDCVRVTYVNESDESSKSCPARSSDPSGSLLGSGAVRPRAHKQLGVPHFTGWSISGTARPISRVGDVWLCG